MTPPPANSHLIPALRAVLQELESRPEDEAAQPEFQNLKAQIIAALADAELREQTAAAPPPATTQNPATAELIEILHSHSAADQLAVPEPPQASAAAPEPEPPPIAES